MQPELTLYDILEVSPRASDQVIKAAYRCLTQANHPDKNLNNDAANKRQARINRAYSVLSDPVRRRRYDEAAELHERFVDRRGVGMTLHGRTGAASADHNGLRAFIFRPLE